MYLDFLSIAALADQIRSDLDGARVQDVVQTDALDLAMELYAGERWYLTLTANSRREGLSLSTERARRGGGKPTRLLLAARSRLVGARLAEIIQPPFERILELVFVGEHEQRLIAEPMGRLANIALLDADGTVVACARPVTSEMTSARVILPGHRYAPPPPQRKALSDEVDEQALSGWLLEHQTLPAWRVLVNRVRGVSPLLAREAVARSLHRNGATQTQELAASDLDPGRALESLSSLLALAETHDWQPSVACEDDAVVAYAPYLLTHLPQPRTMESIAAAIELYERARIGADPYAAARRSVRERIREARARVEQRKQALGRELVAAQDPDELRLAGDLILTYQTEVQQGQRELVASTSPDERPRTIELDPELTPVENAQRYYRKYKRARRAAQQIPRRITETKGQLATLDQLETDLALAEDRRSIDAVDDELVDLGFARRDRGQRQTSGRAQPLRFESSDGFVILVGRNSRQNEIVTFERAARGDKWLHARDVPGGHVVVKLAGRPLTRRALQEAAELAAWFSKDRDRSRVPVAATDVRYVRRMPGAGPGMVVYDHDETILAEPRPPGRLEERRARSSDQS